MRALLIASFSYLFLVAAQIGLLTGVAELPARLMTSLGYLFVGMVPIYGSGLFMFLEKELLPKSVGEEASELFEAQWSVWYADKSSQDRTAA